jgi:hypothetical protein
MSGQESSRVPQAGNDFTAFHIQDNIALSGNVHMSTSSYRSEHGKGKSKPEASIAGMARRTCGIILLLVTVFLWTGSNFLASVRMSLAKS